MRGHVWRQDELKILRESWAAGVTADAIGARLGGLSRSAVLGKIFRLRLAATPATKRKTEAVTPIDQALARRRRSPQRIKQTPPPPKQHSALFDLTNTSCRWPFGRPGAPNFHFCAEPEADLERGIPYCPQHMWRAYAAAPDPKTAAPTKPAAALSRWR